MPSIGSINQKLVKSLLYLFSAVSSDTIGYSRLSFCISLVSKSLTSISALVTGVLSDFIFFFMSFLRSI